MKLTKSLFLAFAGLGLFACSNEDVADNGGAQFKGNGAVAVKIVSPDLLTRNAGGATTGDANTSVAITGDLVITLTGKTLDAEGNPTVPYKQSITIDAVKLKSASEESATILKFWNIAVPEKLTASINGGVDNYESVSLSTLQVAAANVPAYGETTNFIKKSDTEGQSPNLGEDNDTKEDGTEQGAGEGDATKVYEMYEASVTMAIPVARLEVSNITHVAHAGEPDDVCEYTNLIANGAYLDGYTLQGSRFSATAFPASTGEPKDFRYDGEHGTGDESDLKDLLGTAEAGLPFMSGQTLAGPFTYNFYANGTNPIFKLFFGTAKGTNIIEPRYAMVTKYKDTEGNEVTFQNGHIYRILSATLYDKNIIGDEGGNTLFGVEVTVEEATWTLHTIEADWAE